MGFYNLISKTVNSTEKKNTEKGGKFHRKGF